MENRLRIHVLGPPIIQAAGGQTLTGDQISVKGQALLIYLAVTGQSHTRSSLAGLLWGDLPEESARANLRLTLSRLRKPLSENHLETSRLEIGLTGYWLDLDELRQIAHQDLHRLCDLYRDEFLAGFEVPNAPEFEMWLLQMRREAREMALAALARHAESALAAGETEAGIQASRKLLTIEPWDEEGHRKLMRLLAASGQRAAALVQFETCRRLLQEELNVEPDPATVELYTRIRDGSLSNGPPPAQASAILTSGPTFARNPATPRHNLPVDLMPLVGRAAELAQIGAMLDDPACRLLTLVGPGGIGKTRLAIAAAQARLAAFGDGVRFASLVGVMPSATTDAGALLVASIANALDYTFAAQQPPRELLLHHLAGQELLLVLDNFEQFLPRAGENNGAIELVMEILRHASGVKLLISSQQRLGAKAEWLYDVPGLAYPPKTGSGPVHDYPAVRFFVHTAQRLKPEFDLADEQPAVSQLCRRLEGSPLALELAAGWVRVLSCAEMVARLEEAQPASQGAGLELLTAAQSSATDRHHSMRAVLGYSWQFLSTVEQETVRRLSIFRGGFELSAAEAVTGAGFTTLAGLVDKSWLRQNESERFRVHDVLRQYAAEQLAKNSDEQVVLEEAHARYYAEFLAARRTLLVERADPIHLADLDREVQNIRAAWTWHLAHAQLQALSDFLGDLWRYYQYKGWFPEAIAAISQVYTRADATAEEKARWQRWMGDAYYQMGDMQKSQRYLAQAMATLGWPLPATPMGWRLFLAGGILRQALHRLVPFRLFRPSTEPSRLLAEGSRTMGGLSQIYFLTEQDTQLFACACHDLNLAERAGAVAELARGYSTISHVLVHVPLHALAGRYIRLAQQALRQADRAAVRIYALQVIGMCKLEIGHWTEAVEALEQSVKLMEHAERRRWWEESCTLLAVVAYHQGRYRAGLAQYAEVLASAGYRGDPLVQCWALVGQSHIALRLGLVEDGRVFAWLEKANALPTASLTLVDRINVNGTLARAYLYSGDIERAWQTATFTTRLARQARVPLFWAGEGYAGPAEVYLALWEKHMQGDQVPGTLDSLIQAARQTYRDLHGFARYFHFGRAQAWLYQGWYERLAGKPRQAQRAWHKGLTWARQLAMPFEEARIHHELGRHLPPDDPARRLHLAQAEEIYARLNCRLHLAQIRAARQE